MINRKFLLAVPATLFMAACGQADRAVANGETTKVADAPASVLTNCPEPDANGIIEIQDGLTATITKAGYGRAAMSKDYVDVHTTLWLYDEAAEGGRGAEIWSSGGVDPFQFQLDTGQVIRGWDLGVECMLIGEIRELEIASDLAYGPAGRGNIPPNAPLLFEIELTNLTSPEQAN